MEYLFIIAFVGLLIFKAIKGSNRTKKEETGKTMLPGKRSTVTADGKNRPQPERSESWEEWFDGKSTENKNPASIEKKSVYQPIVVTPSKAIRKNKEELHQSPPARKPVRLDSKENVKRAIIYSEIINRKY